MPDAGHNPFVHDATGAEVVGQVIIVIAKVHVAVCVIVLWDASVIAVSEAATASCAWIKANKMANTWLKKALIDDAYWIVNECESIFDYTWSNSERQVTGT